MDEQKNTSETEIQKTEPAESKKRCFGLVVRRLAKRWFIDAFSGMALGLFATLIAGTIFEQLGKLLGLEQHWIAICFAGGNRCEGMMGAGMSAALPIRSSKTSAIFLRSRYGERKRKRLASTLKPVASAIRRTYLAALISAEICSLVAGRTKLDIIVLPLLAMLVAGVVAVTLCPPVTWLLAKLGEGIALATEFTPFFMGIIIAVVMGILLTLPTSSAAIWVAIALNNTSDAMLLAGGAAVVGCCCHMVGFAVMSFKENRWSGLISQGIGTSMLQIPNVMKNPRILIPPTLASAICGPLATCLFGLRCNASGGGMGTAGLVGLFGTIEASAGVVDTWLLVTGIVLLMFVLPAVLSWAFCLILRKAGWIKENDLKLELASAK
ncbi:MAG: PTS transporter subunit IIC [Christensenellales bacterium]